MDTGQKVDMTHPVAELLNTYPKEGVIRIEKVLRHVYGVSRGNQRAFEALAIKLTNGERAGSSGIQ
jgi:hypothetical protein